MRRQHPCPYCRCAEDEDGMGAIDVTAPFYALVIAAERAWTEISGEDRRLGRPKWRPFHTRGAA